jgi:methionyl-tRNA synthetase
MSKFYITTTLPYVNADPHIGFAAEIIKADVIARWQRLLGDDVFFNTGTDEHGQKIYEKAKEAGVDPQTYCDQYAAKFRSLKELLNLSVTNFIRTTDEKHILAAQEFWKRCEANGDIYKKNYKVKYCVGCELEKTDSELVNGCCPLHPDKQVTEIEEENYFFKFSKYQQPLLDFYKDRPDFVKPDWRFNEIRSFVERGLQDFSISRLSAKMPWGIPVPGDDSQVMYVWFDALVNYISCLAGQTRNPPRPARRRPPLPRRGRNLVNFGRDCRFAEKII